MLRQKEKEKWGFHGVSDGKESDYNATDLGLIPGSGRSSGEGNGYPLQYSCLKNSMDRILMLRLTSKMYYNKFPLRIPWSGGLLSMGSQRVRQD